MASIATFILGTFPGWHEEIDRETGSEVDVKPFPSRPLSQAALFLYSAAAAFSLISALWQHIATATVASVADIVYQGTVKAQTGVTALVFAWLAFFLLAIIAIMVLVMILSIHLLDRLADDDDE